MLAFILLALGICSRFLTHAPNLTPVVAVALFAGVYLNKRYALIVPLFLMVLSDIFIGFHDTIAFTWGSVVVVALLGFWTREHKNFKTILGASLLSAVVFFIVTNFGAWLSPLYPNTLEGFVQCYVAAIPFFRNTVIGTLLYSAVLFGIYEYVASHGRLNHATLKKIAIVVLVLLALEPFTSLTLWGNNEKTRASFNYGQTIIAKEINSQPKEKAKYIIVPDGGFIHMQTTVFLTDSATEKTRREKNINFVDQNFEIPQNSYWVRL